MKNKELSVIRFPSPSRERARERGATQKGFSASILLVILTVGIIAAVWLTQTGTSFIPWAAEQEALNPSLGKTKNCAEAEDKEKCRTENSVICAKDTVTYCDNRSGSPRAIRKSGGYYTDDSSDPLYIHRDTTSGCVFDFREVTDKKSECGKPESKSGDVVYTTKDEAEKLDTDRKNSLPERERQSGNSSGNNTTDAVCTEPGVETAMKDEKVTGNIVRYYAILAGQPTYCTPADLGVESKKEGQSSSSGKTGRLMLCSKEDSSLTWRVIVTVDSKLKLEASTKADPSKEEAESEMKQNLEEALKVASPTQTTTQPSNTTPTSGSDCPGGVCP